MKRKILITLAIAAYALMCSTASAHAEAVSILTALFTYLGASATVATIAANVLVIPVGGRIISSLRKKP